MSRWFKVGLVALGISLVPVSFALADSLPGSPSAKRGSTLEAKVGDVAKVHKGDKNFPMEGSKYLQRVESRIAKAKQKVTDKLAEKGVAEEKRKEAMADFDAGAAKVRAAAALAAKDGTVTLEEAQGVRELAKQQRKDLRKKYKLGKGKGKGKGKKGKGAPV